MTAEKTILKERLETILKEWGMTVHPDADLFPMLSGAEMSELVRDIEARGLIEPIIIKKGEVWDGRNRLVACKEAKVEPSFKAPPAGIAAHDYIISANIHRRHLAPEEKRDLITKLIKQTPNTSDRQIAKKAKVSPTLVGKIRKEAEAAGDVSTVDTRTDTKGRKQPASKPAKPKPASVNGSGEISADDRRGKEATDFVQRQTLATRKFIERAMNACAGKERGEYLGSVARVVVDLKKTLKKEAV
jgi:ParB-like chromosome segregation protein Spo0J